MIFTETTLKGAFIIDLKKHEDARGFFARSWCQREFEEQRLDARVAQCNISYNKRKGTIRGMHYQLLPFAESKLVRCTQGAIFDVIVDLRPDSPTFSKWLGVELTAKNHKMLFVPMRFGHGFQTLTDHTEVFYQMSEFHAPAQARGFRWNDPLFKIHWPEAVSLISEKDRAYDDCNPERLHAELTC